MQHQKEGILDYLGGASFRLAWWWESLASFN